MSFIYLFIWNIEEQVSSWKKDSKILFYVDLLEFIDWKEKAHRRFQNSLFQIEIAFEIIPLNVKIVCCIYTFSVRCVVIYSLVGANFHLKYKFEENILRFKSFL